MYGQKEFALFYAASALSASLMHMALDVYTGNNVPAIGASGAVMGTMMLYAIHYPRTTIRIIFFPIEVRWLVLIYLIFDLHPVLLALSGQQVHDGIAHAAHLGGLAFGFVYWKFDLRLDQYWDRIQLGKWQPKRQVRPKATIEHPAKRRLEQELDAVLQKLHEEGLESLTEHERNVLQQASARFREKLQF
jgi:hypothetical protein